jgi:glycosyltransferase involved in cell wall biosynthesis
MPNFKVSVVIPVYNAEKYLRKAVESAVHLEEVGEILLIEDNSPDGALQLCSDLAKEYPKVKVFTHPNRENRGAGESRNLGVRNAMYDYIAFLDADDYFLPQRFEAAKRIFCSGKSIDGVYDAVGTKYYDGAKANIELKKGLTTIPSRPSGQELFETLLNPGNGHFCTDGIIVRKSLIEEAGYFNTSLRLHQDTDMWIKLSYLGYIVPGETSTAVAMRGVHENNRIASRSYDSKGRLHASLFLFFIDKPISRKAGFFILRNYVLYNKKRYENKLMNGFSNIVFAIRTLIRHPRYLGKLLIGS